MHEGYFVNVNDGTGSNVYVTQVTGRPPVFSGPGSIFGIATGYGLDGPGSNPGGGEIFRNCPDRPSGPSSLLYNGYWVFPGVKSGRGVTMTSHPLLVSWS
jgi:hypothetical protein